MIPSSACQPWRPDQPGQAGHRGGSPELHHHQGHDLFALAREAFRGGQTEFQVQVLPFRMTPANMVAYRNDPNIELWRNLEQGYDIFEVTRREPKVAACGRHYVFDPAPGIAAKLHPLLPCPDLEAPVDSQIAAHDADESTQMAQLVASGMVDMPLVYTDGGMNPVFREALLEFGPERLAKKTSFDDVAISRPRAALADPYRPTPAARQMTLLLGARMPLARAEYEGGGRQQQTVLDGSAGGTDLPSDTSRPRR